MNLDGTTSANEFTLNSSSLVLPLLTLDQIERNVITARLVAFNGHRTNTAKSLGISIRTLRIKLARYRSEGSAV